MAFDSFWTIKNMKDINEYCINPFFTVEQSQQSNKHKLKLNCNLSNYIPDNTDKINEKLNMLQEMISEMIPKKSDIEKMISEMIPKKSDKENMISELMPSNSNQGNSNEGNNTQQNKSSLDVLSIVSLVISLLSMVCIVVLGVYTKIKTKKPPRLVDDHGDELI
jgi:hypothetical protein